MSPKQETLMDMREDIRISEQEREREKRFVFFKYRLNMNQSKMFEKYNGSLDVSGMTNDELVSYDMMISMDDKMPHQVVFNFIIRKLKRRFLYLVLAHLLNYLRLLP